MLNKLRKRIKYKFQCIKLKKRNILLDENIVFRKTLFEGRNTIGKNSDIEKSFIGLGTYIGANSRLCGVKIGRFCSIGMRVSAIIGDHPVDYVSTHPFAYSNLKRKIGFDYQNIVLREAIKPLESGYVIEIGNDVWIGDGVQILNGIKIGDGAVIGAGAVVTKNVEPYSILVGNPARILRKRFSEEDIEILLKFKWWNKDLKWIEANVEYFSDIKIFVEKIDEKR